MKRGIASNIINIDLLRLLLLLEVEVGSVVLVGFAVGVRVRTLAVTLIVILHEFDAARPACSIGVFVDLEILRNLALRLQLPDLVRQVLEDDIALFVLELPQAAHHEISNADPHLLLHLSADVAHAIDLIEALDQHSSVAEHLGGESILEALVVLLGEELALDWSRVFSSLVILTSSSLVLRHDNKVVVDGEK